MLAAGLSSYKDAWTSLHGTRPEWLCASDQLPKRALTFLMLHDQPLLQSLFHHRPELWNSRCMAAFQHSLWQAFSSVEDGQPGHSSQS